MTNDTRLTESPEGFAGLAVSNARVGTGPRLTCTVNEAAELLGISRGTAYKCVREGRLRSISIGRRIVVPLAAIEELLGDGANSDIPTRTV